MRASPMSCRRIRGSLRRHRWITRRNDDGVSSGSHDQWGSDLRISLRISVVVDPENGGRPASNSKVSQPAESLHLPVLRLAIFDLTRHSFALGQSSPGTNTNQPRNRSPTRVKT